MFTFWCNPVTIPKPPCCIDRVQFLPMIDTLLFDLAGTTIDCGGSSSAEEPDFRPIPGFSRMFSQFRARGYHIGATCEYSPPVIETLKPRMMAKGWNPEVLLGPGDVTAGRPAPYMNLMAAIRLGCRDVRRCVVFGDTPLDMEAARNAGMWAVGVMLTSKEVGLPWEEVMLLSDDARALTRTRVGDLLEKAGAHLVVDSVLDLSRALAVLERPSVAAYKRWARSR